MNACFIILYFQYRPSVPDQPLCLQPMKHTRHFRQSIILFTIQSKLLLSFRHLSERRFLLGFFILNENILFWLTISNQKPFVFSVSVFCSQIFTVKLNLRPKIGLTYTISIVKWFFGVFVYENIFYFSLLNLNYWCFTTILWKFQKNWTNGTCWKSASKLPTLQISAKFAFIFTIGKSENISFFKMNRIKLFVYR